MKSNIPKIIHQIWIGNDDMPSHCVQFTKEMKEINPDWEYHLWGNELLTDVYKDDPFLQNYIKNPDLYKWAFICDRIRLLLLRDFGGIYVDVDARPVRSFDLILEKLHQNHTFFAGLKPSQENNTLIDCTIYGSAPRSRAVTVCLNTYNNINWANGCKMFSDALIQNMDVDIALFNYKWFYNWDVNDLHTIVLHDVEETRLFSWLGEDQKKVW